MMNAGQDKRISTYQTYLYLSLSFRNLYLNKGNYIIYEKL